MRSLVLRAARTGETWIILAGVGWATLPALLDLETLLGRERLQAARNLEFERAAELRDQLKKTAQERAELAVVRF